MKLEEEIIVEKTEKVLEEKKFGFDEKCVFLCDTIKLLASEKYNYSLVKKIFTMLLDVFDEYCVEIPRVLPEFCSNNDLIIEKYITTVKVIDSVYHEEEIFLLF